MDETQLVSRKFQSLSFCRRYSSNIMRVRACCKLWEWRWWSYRKHFYMERLVILILPVTTLNCCRRRRHHHHRWLQIFAIILQLIFPFISGSLGMHCRGLTFIFTSRFLIFWSSFTKKARKRSQIYDCRPQYGRLLHKTVTAACAYCDPRVKISLSPNHVYGSVFSRIIMSNNNSINVIYTNWLKWSKWNDNQIQTEDRDGQLWRCRDRYWTLKSVRRRIMAVRI